jgi:hypothetical protein
MEKVESFDVYLSLKKLFSTFLPFKQCFDGEGYFQEELGL